MAQELDVNLHHFAQVILRDLHSDVKHLSFGGASGGVGAALYAFMGADLKRGIDLVLDHIGFERHLANCDLVITAEGKLDLQTLRGKAPYGVAQSARRMGIPIVNIVGAIDKDAETADFSIFDVVVPICTRPMPLSLSMKYAPSLITAAAERTASLLAMGMRLTGQIMNSEV